MKALPAPAVLVTHPAALDVQAMDELVALVRDAGEVDHFGLRQRILRAAAIAQLHVGSRLMGVAALKRPTANHRHEVSTGARVELRLAEFPFELGWTVVAAEARRQGHSMSLCQALVSHATDDGIFATSRAWNVYMHRTLIRLGFLRCGIDWKSQRSAESLALFVRAGIPQIAAFAPG